jgi:ATP-dependent Lon protease
MRDFRDAKAMAQTLRDTLKAKSVSLTHSESLEIVAKTLGFHDWNVLSAAIQSSQPPASASTPDAPPLSAFATGVPVVPMRDVVFFPQMVTPIFVGREKTRRAIESALAHDGRLAVLTQRRMADDDPGFDDLYTIGVTASIISRQEMPNGNLKCKVSCLERVRVLRPLESEFLIAEVEPVAGKRASDVDTFRLAAQLMEAYRAYAKVPKPQALYRYSGEPEVLANVVAQLITDDIERLQQLLETDDVVVALETVLGWMKEQAAA